MRQNSNSIYRRHIGVISIVLALSAQSCSLFSASTQTKSATSTTTTTTASNATATTSQTAATAIHASTSHNISATSQIGEQNTQHFIVPEPNTDLSATDWLVLAQDAYDTQRYGDAFSAAIQAYHIANASGDSDVVDEATTAAIVAAAQLDVRELTSRSQSATSAAESAILTRVLASICHRQGDRDCVATQVDQSARAWEALGDDSQARQMVKWGDSLHPDLPIVAVMLPLSGKDRRMGRAMLGSFLLAGGIYDHRELPFALRFFDTQSDASAIESIVSSFANSPIRLVLGPVDVLESTKAAQLLPADISMIGFSPNDAFLGDRPNVFQYAYTLDREAQAIAERLVDMSPRRAIAIAPQNAYAETTLAQVNAFLPPAFAMSAELYPASQTDLRDVAKRITSQNPDVLFFPAQADDAERIASFLAQENMWCTTPGTPAPKASTDTRQFVTCLSTSAWAPIRSDHRYKFIVNALYLDYMATADDIDAAFSSQFSTLYHRLPSVYEVVPYAIVSMLRAVSASAWKSPDALQDAIYQILNGNQYLLTPEVRQVVSNGSISYPSTSTPMSTMGPGSSNTSQAPSLPVRSLTVK